MQKRIAIIDDDPDFRQAMRIILETAGYLCIEAVSAEKGFEAIEAFDVDLIILDVMMEDISAGFRFAKRLNEYEKHNAKHTPVLMVSSIQHLTNLPFESRKHTQWMPADDFLDKPVKPEELLQHVEHLIGLNDSPPEIAKGGRSGETAHSISRR